MSKDKPTPQRQMAQDGYPGITRNNPKLKAPEPPTGGSSVKPPKEPKKK